jgi:hypothetical protein
MSAQPHLPRPAGGALSYRQARLFWRRRVRVSRGVRVARHASPEGFNGDRRFDPAQVGHGGDASPCESSGSVGERDGATVGTPDSGRGRRDHAPAVWLGAYTATDGHGGDLDIQVAAAASSSRRRRSATEAVQPGIMLCTRTTTPAPARSA